MKKISYLILAVLCACTNNSRAISNNTVEIAYSGNTATVTVASNISSYITVTSGNSSHVSITQSPLVDANVGEIFYVLSGTSADGEFYMEGAYKATVTLNNLNLSNPSGPAINLQNGKRIDVSIQNGTTNTLSDGANDLYNGCFHCKGHAKFKGRGVLNIAGNSRHAIYSKEYVEVKNCTINITAAVKDGIHCQEYFLMESGTLNISGVQDDGIQVELKGLTSTGITTDHADEDSGNFYMTDGTLTISNYGGKAIKTDGTITYSGGTQNFDTADTMTDATAIATIQTDDHAATTPSAVYDINGRQLSRQGLKRQGIYIVRSGNTTQKLLVR